MKIGMLGLQSRHLDFFTKQINLERRFPDVSVVGVWGEDEPERLPDIAAELSIPVICNTLGDLLEICDTVFVLPRNGYTHMAYARAAQATGKNVFVDKPFALSGEDASNLIRTAFDQHLTITGGSTLCHLPIISDIGDIAIASPKTVISYSADPDSVYGGWAYYGSHLCDLCVALSGVGIFSVQAEMRGKEVRITVDYGDRQTILHSSPVPQKPTVCSGRELSERYVLDDETCFRYGLEKFISELQNIDNESLDRLRVSSMLLEGCLCSLKDGNKVRF